MRSCARGWRIPVESPASVEIDSDILKIISSDQNLADSDFRINNGVSVLDPNLRGLEAGDFVTMPGCERSTSTGRPELLATTSAC